MTYSIKRTLKGSTFTALFSEEIEGAYRYKGLELNVKKGTLKYKNNKTIEISPDNKAIKFLSLLMEQPKIIISYSNIAEKLDINSKAHGGNLVSAVKDIKKQLLIIIHETGMSPQKIGDFILAKKNQGYKLR